MALPWQCAACTLVNPASRDHCDACNNPRQRGPVLVIDPGSPTEEALHAPTASDSSGTSSKLTTAVQPAMVQSTLAGLHSAERKAREDDLVAKRQKKEEEKQRILAQAEEDRKSREEEASRFSEVVPVLAQQQGQTAQAKSLPSSVRLQLRCPQWNRNIILTSLSPQSTIGEVRKRLREELLHGLSENGTAASEARVPQEEAIVLAESVPPRRKFVTAEDMHITLAAAGLCPSSMLLVDAAPIAVESACPESSLDNAGHSSALMQDQQDEEAHDHGHDERGEHDDQDEDDVDDSDDEDEDLFGIKGKAGGKATGSGTFGRGPSQSARPAVLPGGIRPGNARPGGSRPGAHSSAPRIGAGGQILGNGPAPGAGSTSEEQQLARAARLMALERRTAAVPTPHAEELVARPEEPHPSLSSAPDPTPQAFSPARQSQGTDKKDAEQKDILRQAAEERAERATKTGKTASQPSKPVVPAEDPSRIKGQLGGSSSKAERARERAAILQQMEEDRGRYQEMHVAEKTIAAHVAANTQPVSSMAAGSVRLQVRCASSGRSVTTTDFTGKDSLICVRDFAAKELGLIPGSGTDGPELSLAFPPRTAFTSQEQIHASLESLGLAPSAGLIIKGLASWPAPSNSADEELQQAPSDADETVHQGSADVAPCCPIGHAMTQHEPSEDMWCDRCQKSLPAGSSAFNCAHCDYIECMACAGCDV